MTDGSCCNVPMLILIGAARRIDGAQFLAVDQFDGIADGQTLVTPLKFLAIRDPHNFAKQIDEGAGDVAVGRRQVLCATTSVIMATITELAQRILTKRPTVTHFGMAHLAVSHEAHSSKRAAHQNHTSKRCHGS